MKLFNEKLFGVANLLRFGRGNSQIKGQPSRLEVKNVDNSDYAPLSAAAPTIEQDVPRNRELQNRGQYGVITVNLAVDGTSLPTFSSYIGEFFIVTVTGGGYVKDEIWRIAPPISGTGTEELIRIFDPSNPINPPIIRTTTSTGLRQAIREWDNTKSQWSIASGSGGGSSVVVDVANSFAPGQLVRHVINDTWALAQADSADNVADGIISSADATRFIVLQEGEMELTTTEWDNVLESTEPTGGLIPGTWYYLSESEAGKITTVKPAISVIALRAMTTTKAMVVNHIAVASGLGNTVVSVEGTAFAGQNNITLPKNPYDPKFVFLWINAIKQPPSSYTLSGNDIIVSPMISGDIYEVQALVSYPITNSNLIIDDLQGNSSMVAVSQRQVKASGKQVGELFPMIIDKPISSDFPAFRIDIYTELNNINHPDIFPLLYNQQIVINNNSQFQITGSQDNGGSVQLILANNTDNLLFMSALYSDLLYHGSGALNYTNWRTITIPTSLSATGTLNAGTYDITDIDPINNLITINVPFNGDIGTGNIECFWFRLSNSTTLTRWHTVTDSVIRTPGGDSIPGVRLRDRMQSHNHQDYGHDHSQVYRTFVGVVAYAGLALATDHTLTTTFTGQGYANLSDPTDSGTGAGTPRHGNTTRDRSLSAFWYMHIGRYIP